MLRKLFFHLFTALSLNAHSQDANYWSSSYGAGSFFVPGGTIANNGDSGVLFYNPALLAYNTKNSASISGTLYDLQTTKIKDGAGTGLDLKSTNASIVPVIVANTIYLKLKKLYFFFIIILNFYWFKNLKLYECKDRFFSRCITC